MSLTGYYGVVCRKNTDVFFKYSHYIRFVGGVGGYIYCVFIVIFVSNPTTVEVEVVLCCQWVGVVMWQHNEQLFEIFVRKHFLYGWQLVDRGHHCTALVCYLLLSVVLRLWLELEFDIYGNTDSCSWNIKYCINYDVRVVYYSSNLSVQILQCFESKFLGT